MSNLQAAYAAAFKVTPDTLIMSQLSWRIVEVIPGLCLLWYVYIYTSCMVFQICSTTWTLVYSYTTACVLYLTRWKPYLLQNIRPSADNLPEELSEILTSCWKEDPNERPNFTQIVQMLLHYLSTLSPQETLAPRRTFSSENTILPPESPGTSSLMASRGDLGDTTKGKKEDKPRGFFFCFSECY